MAQDYNVVTDANGNPFRITTNDAFALPVRFDDANFRAWNAARSVPYPFSVKQQAIIKARTSWGSLTAADKDVLLQAVLDLL